MSKSIAIKYAKAFAKDIGIEGNYGVNGIDDNSALNAFCNFMSDPENIQGGCYRRRDMSKEPLTVYFHDNASATIYRLTRAQLERLAEDDDWNTAEKFAITNLPSVEGYIPDYLLELASIYGFEVDSV